MQLDQATTRFLDFERYTRNCAPRSVELYRFYLARFQALAGPEKTVDQAGRLAEEYLTRFGRGGISDYARLKVFQVLRFFFRWCCERGLAKANPLRDMRPPIVRERPRTFLNKAEALELLRVIRSSGRMHSIRDHALFAVMFYAGLRVSEACRLRWEDVDLERGILVACGKGGRVDQIPIHPDLVNILRAWRGRRDAACELVYPSGARNSGRQGRLDACRVERVLRKLYAPEAGLSGRVTPHTLRRSFATELRRRGVPLEHVQKLLRHSCITTTMHYLKDYDVEELRGSVGKL